MTLSIRRNKEIVLAAALLIAATLVASSGCHRRLATEKRYELKGKVVVVEKDKRLVTISHEDIKGYMPGMVMPFAVKEDWALEMLAPGNEIHATLVVDGSTSWLENIVSTEQRVDTSSPKTDGPVEAKAGDEVPNFSLVNQGDKQI